MEAILTALRTAPALQERLKTKKNPYCSEAIHNIIKSISPLTIEEIKSIVAVAGQTAVSDMMSIIRERHTPPKPVAVAVAVPEPEPVAVPEPEPEPVIVPYITNFLYPKAPVKTKAPKEPKEPKTIPVVAGGGVHMKHNLSKGEFITEEWARQWLIGAVPDDRNLHDVGTRYLKGMWHLAKKGSWRVPEVGEKMSTGTLGSIPAIIGYLRTYRTANTPGADAMYAEPGSD